MDKQYEKGSVAMIIVLALTALLVVVSGYMFGTTKASIDQTEASVASTKAEHAAASGLDKIFSRFQSKAHSSEVNNMLDWIDKGKLAGNLPSFYLNRADSKSASTKAWVKANEKNLLIYNITDMGLIQASTWSPTAKAPQVALWVTSFKRPTAVGGFPYAQQIHVNKASQANKALDLVAYSYASDGKGASSMRERVAWGDTVAGISPLMNAPDFATSAAMCGATEPVVTIDPDTGESTVAYVGGIPDAGVNDTPNESGTSNHFLYIDATQAEGSVAIQSNSSLHFPGMDDELSGKSVVASNGEPIIVYDNGKTGGAYPASTSTLLSDEPSLAQGNLRGTASESDYFASAESELLPMDAYRAAADRIAGVTGELIGGKLMLVSGTQGSYASLRDNNEGHGRTGTVSMSDFVYNVKHSIPMYGIVRVMVPAVPQWSVAKTEDRMRDILVSLGMSGSYSLVAENGLETSGVMSDVIVNNNEGKQNRDSGDGSERDSDRGHGDNAKSGGDKHGSSADSGRKGKDGRHDGQAGDGESGSSGDGSASSGSGETPLLSACGVQAYKVSFNYDGNTGHTLGSMNKPGKIIVYGSLMFDFFTDNDGNGKFNPSTERVLSHKEAQAVTLLVRSPVFINPVLARSHGVITSDSDYLNINSYPTGASSNSLSTDADISNEEMPIAEQITTIMNDYENAVYGGGYKYTDMVSLLGPDSSYIDQMGYMFAATANGSRSTYSDKTISDMDNDVLGFSIDTMTDVVTTSQSSKLEEASSADLFHAMLPSGYTHGWKRAMNVTGMAPVWNTLIKPSDPGYLDNVLHIDGERIDSTFGDIPAIAVGGGHVRFRGAMNVSGLLYNSGSFTFEQTHESKDGDVTPSQDGDSDVASEDTHEDVVFGSDKYISGGVVTGFGQFYRNTPTAGSSSDEDDSRVIIISHDRTGFDNLPVNARTKIIKRTHAQIM